MAEVTFPAEYGGDGNTYSDDADPNTGLDGVGYMTRFVPCLAGAVKMAAFAKGQADAAQQFAETCQTLRNEAAQSKESAASSASKAAANKQATDEALAEAKSRIGSSQALVDACDSAQQNAEATGQDRDAVAQNLQHVGQQRQAVDAAAEQVAADREQTGKDRIATKADAEATAADREQTAEDRVATNADTDATAADREQTGKDRIATKADAQSTAQDREAAQTAAASVDADKIMHAKGSGLPNEVGTAATRNVGTEAGNLMQVGAFGLGTLKPDPYPLSDIDADPSRVPSGTYITPPDIANSPMGPSILEIDRYDDERVRMTMTRDYQTNVTLSRTWFKGVWQPWDRHFTSRTAVGTVVDGSPTSAIIESGKNSNGSYIKLADGTLENRKAWIATQTNSAAIYGTWNFPHAFIDTDYTVTMLYNRSPRISESGSTEATVLGQGLFYSQPYSGSRNGILLGVLNYSQDMSEFSQAGFDVVAKGRWK